MTRTLLFIFLGVFSASTAAAAMPDVNNIQKADAFIPFIAPTEPVTITISGGCVAAVGGCFSGEKTNTNLASVEVTAAETYPFNQQKDAVAIKVDPAVNPGDPTNGFSATNAHGDQITFMIRDAFEEVENTGADNWFYASPGRTNNIWALDLKGTQTILPGNYSISIFGGVYQL